MQQPLLFDVRPSTFPRTRYQGSKRKLASFIVDALQDLKFTTVLDAFGGTGAVSYALKQAGKAVTYNDVLSFNHQVGLALVENEGVTLDEHDLADILHEHPGLNYPDFIERTFEGIYFTTEENGWLDMAVTNIRAMPCRFKRAVAWFALFQSALAKRPYNLFHRGNLNMRTANVKRSFGNKTCWDRGFEEHFRAFAEEAGGAVFSSCEPCVATCQDVLEIEPVFDLVYLDPPYLNAAGVGVDYRDFYHFLEGIMNYDVWPQQLDRSSKHLRLKTRENGWCSHRTNREMFRRAFQRFRESIIVVSYRSDGIPPIDDLSRLLREVKRRVRIVEAPSRPYALSIRRTTQEVLLIGTD